MNQKCKRILKVLQSDFPIARQPFKVMAKKLDLDEKELLLKIKRLKNAGVIRRIGAVLNPRPLKIKSSLIGLRVRKDALKNVACFINKCANVSHNYLRSGDYNVWFTFSARAAGEKNKFLKALRQKKGVRDLLVLNSKKQFKINTRFEF
ncbi:MAG: hypothetical protein ABII75_00435 [Candidatus Omnitrophota bacterium]